MTLKSSCLAIGMTLFLFSAVLAQGKEPKQPAAAKSPLEAKLVANEDTYTLAKDQQGEAFAEMLKANKTGDLPAPPAVDLVLEIKNPTDAPITILVDSDAGALDLQLAGPGAVTVPGQRIFTREFRLGKPVAIAAGATHKMPIKALKFGFRGVGTYAYWTEPGEYTLAATFTWPAERDGRGKMMVQAEPIKLTVKAAE